MLRIGSDSPERPFGGREAAAEINSGSAGTVVFISTVPESLWYFARPHWSWLRERGYKVTVISSPGSFLQQCLDGGADRIFAINLYRSITPIKDLASFVRLARLLKTIRPSVVHTHTPKAGLLGMMAAAVAGVGIRIYTFNGALWLVGPAWKRRIFQWADRLACLLATNVVCVSPSLRDAVIRGRVCDARKAAVLGPGTSHGVDIGLFDPDRTSAENCEALKRELGIPTHCSVLGFVGRITPDKGIRELHEAWRLLRSEFPYLYLLLCGPVESDRGNANEIVRSLDSDLRVKRVALPHARMPFAYAVMDVCALPSHREGFPNVALEAGSMRVPVVTTTAVGCRDAVNDGVTGLLVPAGDACALRTAISTLLRSDHLRLRLGADARDRVVADFSESAVRARFRNYYEGLLSKTARR
jgi:glycosyltransferase involved in cell wall biosynthesis